VTIELIQVDDSGKPLSVGQTLSNLQDVAETLAKSEMFSGAEVGFPSAVNPIVCSQGCVNGECTDRDQCSCNDGWAGPACDAVAQGELNKQESGSSTAVIVGAVVAVVIFIVLLVVAVIVIFVLVKKQQEHKKRLHLKQKYARDLEDMESTSTAPATSKSAPDSSSTVVMNTYYSRSAEDNTYDQLPAPNQQPPPIDSDYDQLPALANKGSV
jgi:hypothetical protein